MLTGVITLSGTRRMIYSAGVFFLSISYARTEVLSRGAQSINHHSPINMKNHSLTTIRCILRLRAKEWKSADGELKTLKYVTTTQSCDDGLLSM